MLRCSNGQNKYNLVSKWDNKKSPVDRGEEDMKLDMEKVDAKTAFMPSGADIFASVRPKTLYLLPPKRWGK